MRPARGFAGSHGPRGVSREIEVVVDEAAAVRRVAEDPLAIALVRPECLRRRKS